jgi:hypothetical protein
MALPYCIAYLIDRDVIVLLVLLIAIDYCNNIALDCLWRSLGEPIRGFLVAFHSTVISKLVYILRPPPLMMEARKPVARSQKPQAGNRMLAAGNRADDVNCCVGGTGPSITRNLCGTGE